MNNGTIEQRAAVRLAAMERDLTTGEDNADLRALDYVFIEVLDELASAAGMAEFSRTSRGLAAWEYADDLAEYDAYDGDPTGDIEWFLNDGVPSRCDGRNCRRHDQHPIDAQHGWDNGVAAWGERFAAVWGGVRNLEG